MRTKTILFAAAVFAAGFGVTMAQAPVYSVNAVGYVTKTCTNGYNLLCNPLNGTNNLLSTILPVVPEDSQVLRWNATSQGFADANQFYGGGLGWLPDEAINPGEGFFFYSTAPGNTNLTFVGEVPQGNLTNNLSANYSLMSHVVPQAISLAAGGVNFPVGDDESVLMWNAGAQGFADPLQYYGSELGWLPNEPVPAVGEGFFYFNTGAPRQWTRTFSVN
jgi:hypothetical protein